MGALLLRNICSVPRHRFDNLGALYRSHASAELSGDLAGAFSYGTWRSRPACNHRYTRRKWHTSDCPNPPTLTEKPTQDKSSESRASPARPDSHLVRCNQAAAPALHPFNAATCAKTEGHIDDTKVVNPQPAEKPTDMLPPLFAVDAQLLSLRQASSWYRVCDRGGGASQQHNPGRSRRR